MPETVAVDTSGSLGSALSGIAGTMAREIPGALAEDKANRAIVRDTARATVGAIDQGTREREAMKPPPTPPPNPPPQYQETSMGDKWGSLAMGMAVLGSAFTRRPATNSLNAAAGVLNAYHDSDAAAYKRNFDNWKAQTDYSLKMYEYQRDAYKDAISNIKENSNDAMAKLRVVASAFGDDALKHITSMGNAAAAVAKIDEFNARLPEYRLQSQIMRMKGDLVNEYNATRDTLKTDPGNVEAKQKLHDIMERNKEIEALEGKRPSTTGWTVALDQSKKDEAGNPTPYRYNATTGEATTLDGSAPYAPGGYAKPSATGGGAAAGRLAKTQELYDGYIKEWQADPKHAGKEPSATEKGDLWAKAAGSAAGRNPAALTGTLTPEAVDMNADLYIMGDTGVITSLPRSGPARLQVENKVAEKLATMPEGVRGVALNRMRMAEARSAATTAGRVTMNTELFSQEALQAGAELVRVSKTVPRSEYLNVNQAIQAFETRTGDPNIIALGVALNALRNAYGKMSNPTGTGIHDADKAKFEQIMNTALSHGQIEAGVQQIVTEGRIMSHAAQGAQEEILRRAVPAAPGAVAPAPPSDPAVAPTGSPAAAPTTGATPTITNQKEYDALAPGAEYLGPDGKRYRKK